MDLSNITNEALNRYFNSLSQTGYMNYNNVYYLLILTYIQEINQEELSLEDKNIVRKALDCLYGNSCLIPYINYKQTCK